MSGQPTITEQQMVQKYCISREIKRPKTNLWAAIKLLLLLEGYTLALSGIAFYVSGLLGYTAPFPLWHVTAGLAIIILNLKKIIILSIRLYQHYAPEQIRRKCTLLPSCSDYSILALNKYGLLKALGKIYTRLYHTCNGVYRVDHP